MVSFLSQTTCTIASNSLGHKSAPTGEGPPPAPTLDLFIYFIVVLGGGTL
jgi:hypothetical protein